MNLTAPIAHANDPPTSHLAASQHTSSGRRERGAMLVLSLVQRFPGRTACELYELATASERAELREMQRVRQRLSDMLGVHVKQGISKICSVRGTRQMTWFAIDAVVTLFS